MHKDYFIKSYFLFLSKVLFVHLLLCFISLNGISQNPIGNSHLSQYNSQYHDSLLTSLPQLTKHHLFKGDTLNAIINLIKTSRLNSTAGHYTKAYDGYWDALIYSKSINDLSQVSDIYTGLAILYGLYGRTAEAESYFAKSIALQRHLINTNQLTRPDLINDFYVIASYHRELGNYSTAQSYLDSCWKIKAEYQPSTKTPFLIAEQGRIYYEVV